MIVLEVVEYGGARTVVHELAALVEEGGVVLVSLDHEVAARMAGCHLAQARRNAEVQRHAANQEAGLQAGMFQHPGQHGGGAGLAVGTGQRQHVLALQHMLGQPLRAAGVGQALFQDFFHQRELGAAVLQAGAADHVANHVHVGPQRGLFCAKAFDQVDAERTQLVAHGGIHTGVAAGDLVAGLTGQRGDTSHEGAADTENMDVHALIVRSDCRLPRQGTTCIVPRTA